MIRPNITEDSPITPFLPSNVALQPAATTKVNKVPKPKAPVINDPHDIMMKNPLAFQGKAAAPIAPAPAQPMPSAAPVSPGLPPQNPRFGPEAIRSQGASGYDPNYLQNLAIHIAGGFGRPGGGLSFNPLDPQSLQGERVGGGNAPLFGLPQTLLEQALKRSKFLSPATPAAPGPGTPTPAQPPVAAPGGGFAPSPVIAPPQPAPMPIPLPQPAPNPLNPRQPFGAVPMFGNQRFGGGRAMLR